MNSKAGAPALGGTGLLAVFVGLAIKEGVSVGRTVAGGSLGPNTSCVGVGAGEMISGAGVDPDEDGAQPPQNRRNATNNKNLGITCDLIAERAPLGLFGLKTNGRTSLDIR